MQTVVSGLNRPTDVESLPDGRLFVAEKAGKVRVVKNGQLLAEPLLDISDHVNTYSDSGLLSIAVDPDFGVDGYIYLYCTYSTPGTLLSDPQTRACSHKAECVEDECK